MSSSQIQFKKLRALVVGESSFARSLTRSLLHTIGVELVFEARSGAAAIDDLASRNLDFLLVDWQMDDVNGAGVLKILRNPNFGRNFDLPAIVLADNVSRAMIARARQCGAQQIVAMPLSAQLLHDAVTRVMSDSTRTHKRAVAEWVSDAALDGANAEKASADKVAPVGDHIDDDALEHFFIL